MGLLVEVVRTVVLGTFNLLGCSTASTAIKISFVERNNGTDLHQESRKHCKTCGFSKDLALRWAASYFIGHSHDFCWPERTLRVRKGVRPWQAQTPTMAAGLSDHKWSTNKWLTYPPKPR